MATNLSRRSVISGGLAVAGAAAVPGLAGCGGDTSSNSGGKGDGKEITVGYIADGNGASTVAIANDQDLWKKHGLKANLKKFSDGPVQIEALGAGSLDFGYIGPGALWLPMHGKATITSIVALGEADRVIGQKGISSVKDLKGKKVGVAEGTSGDMLLRIALQKNDMTMNDIKKVAMKPSTIISSFASKRIDAAAIWYPHVAKMKEHVSDLVEVAKDDDYSDVEFPSALVAGPKVEDEKADELKRFQAVAKEANQWNKDHNDEMVSLLTKFIKSDKKSLEEEHKYIKTLSTDELEKYSTDGTIDGWLKKLNKLFVDFDKVKSVADPKKYYLGKQYAKA